MTIVGYGNYWRHHKYKKCPICGKRGVYQPTPMMLRDGTAVKVPVKCKFCGTQWGEYRYCETGELYSRAKTRPLSEIDTTGEYSRAYLRKKR